MRTDELIAKLSSDLKPVTPGTPAWRISGGLIAGGVVSLLAIYARFGPPLGAVEATGISTFEVKLVYTVAMAVLAAVLLLGAGRPGQRKGWRYAWLLVPPLMIAAASSMELSGAPAAAKIALVFGTTWQTCLLSITLMSMPVFVGLLWAFRRLAPTRLRLAGFLAGLCSGATAGVVYALYCPETAATFLISWYTLGMLIAGLGGALAGPRLLRW